MIDALATLPHYLRYVAPVFEALPESVRGNLYTNRRLDYPGAIRTGPATRTSDPIIVAGWHDLRKIPNRPAIFIEHGAGQSYDSGENPAYVGGSGRENVVLFVCPNQEVADKNLARYPNAEAVVAGSPALDVIHLQTYERHPTPAVGLSWHWQCFAWPESQTAFYEYQHLLKDVAKAVPVIGAAHPRIYNEISDYYRQAGIESVSALEEAFKRADIWCVDNSSSAMEFASTGRPIVWVSASFYRRDFSPGGRFWDWTAMGPHVERPEDWIPTLEKTLEEDRYAEMREEWVRRTYAFTDGHAATRAAEAILTMKGAH